MTFAQQVQRSSVTAVAAVSAVAAFSLSALAAGPLTPNSEWRLAASALPSGIVSAIHDVLAEAHAAVRADRGAIAADRQAIRATGRESVHAIGASVLTGDVGEGQVMSIVGAARGAVSESRQSIASSRDDIQLTRQAAAADIRTIVAGSHDGSTVQDVTAIIDTAKMDNAVTRSAIVADAQENKTIRRTTTSEVVAIRQSARAGAISRQDAAQQISTQRSSAHTDIADNHAQMVSSHKEIKMTRQQAAKDVGKTVHQGRTGQ
jgi:hypothetical protein